MRTKWVKSKLFKPVEFVFKDLKENLPLNLDDMVIKVRDLLRGVLDGFGDDGPCLQPCTKLGFYSR